MGKTPRNYWIYPVLTVMIAGLMAGCRSETDRLTGKWQGTLDLTGIPQVKPGTTLRVVCDIRKNQDGTLGGTLDSPDQRTAGIPLDQVTIKDGAVHLYSNKVAAGFDGRLSKDGSQIAGQWKQGGAALTTTLVKGQ